MILFVPVSAVLDNGHVLGHVTTERGDGISRMLCAWHGKKGGGEGKYRIGNARFYRDFTWYLRFFRPFFKESGVMLLNMFVSF